jgi:N-acetylglucosaminyl-diphospho-decaprenol L-rhamnosyltransferase
MNAPSLQPVLDVVIVNWNTGQQLQQCLEALSRSRREGFTFGRVVVVDNASGDGSATDLNSFGLPLHVIQNPTNRGFAAACNQGAEGSRAHYILFLNPDTRVYPDALAKTASFMESAENSRIGIIGVQMVEEDGTVLRHCTRFLATRYFMNVMLGLNRVSPAGFPTHTYEEWDHLQSREIEHVIGAYFLMRRSLFETLGGFDERFFVYYEDVDLSLRAWQAGWSVYYLASARCYHACGGSSRQVKARRLLYILQSRIFYAFKHFGTWNAVGLLLATLFIEPVSRLARAAATGSFGEMGELVHGYFLLWLALPRMLSSDYLRRPYPLKVDFKGRYSGVETHVS